MEGTLTTTSLPAELAGHLGNLTKEQEAVFTTFKENLTNAKLYTPATEGKAASHRETTLICFLRARSFNIVDAQKQFSDSEEWRKKRNVSKLLAEMPTKDFVDAQKYYPRWTGRRNKLGIPYHVYHLASLQPLQRELDAVPAEERYNRIVVLTEYVNTFVFPLCSDLPHSTEPIPISSAMTIIDLENVSFGAMWRLRSHLQEASKLSTANYPETLHSIAIVNSPSFFPTIWNWIKGWFDEGTRRKIHVLGNDMGSTLRDLIDPKDLPVKYGGELEWNFDDLPNLDEDTKKLIGEMPVGPAVFIDGKVVQPPPLPLA